jgi:hypothetical protein
MTGLTRVLYNPTTASVAQDSILSLTLFMITCVYGAHHDENGLSIFSFNFSPV